MADAKISELTSAALVNDAAAMVIAQGGVTKQVASRLVSLGISRRCSVDALHLNSDRILSSVIRR
jgi:hypothetical protein